MMGDKVDGLDATSLIVALILLSPLLALGIATIYHLLKIIWALLRLVV